MRAPDQIVHVHARGPSPAGRRVRYALGHARLSPVTLSPAAVLAVRRLADPLPGALGDGRRVPPRWEGAARDAVADLHRRAARPRGGRIPEAAPAVLFADEAEWRACAALAFAEGRRPWWTDTLDERSVTRLLAEAPRLVPAVLDCLATWGEAAVVLAAVPASEADAILDRTLRTFGGDAATPTRAPVPTRLAAGLPLPWTASAPLTAAIAEVATHVGREQAALLGAGVTLARKPHQLRHPGAVEAVLTWARSASANGPRSGASSPTAPFPLWAGREGNAASGEAPPPVARLEGGPASPDGALVRDPGGHHDLPAPVCEARPSEAAPAEAAPWSDGTATRLGGVFFLLPLLRAFGWPEAEEAAWHLASTTGTWGVLEALGRALLGDAHGEHAADPLWHVLAHLDGREPGAPPRNPVLPPQTDVLSLGVPGLPPTLATWTRGVLPEVETRLGEALGLGGPGEIAPALLVREAALYVTPSHVDLVLPLASASLAVRRAGLDADPGWVPSVGRVVLFHYR